MSKLYIITGPAGVGKSTISKKIAESKKVCWLSIDEINSLMNKNKFFKNHYEEFEILLNWLKEGEKNAT